MKKYPMLLDIHTHFRTPGQEHKEDNDSGTRAARRGGYFAVCTMPNTSPVIDTPEMIHNITQNGVRIYQIAAVTKGLSSDELVDMEGLAKAGAIAFSNDGVPVFKDETVKKAIIEAAKVGLPFIEHCEDTSVPNWQGKVITYKEYLDITGQDREDYDLDSKLWYVAPEVESNMVERDCKLSYELGLPVHLAHISCRKSIEIIEKYKDKGAKITAEVTPHHIALDASATIAKGAMAKMNPPLRNGADVIACREALKNGVLDCIATDHAPHTTVEKRELETAPNGIIGLETAFSCCYTSLVKTGVITLDKLFELMAYNPAKIMNIELPQDEFLTVIEEPVAYDSFLSKSQNSPFLGEQLWGRVENHPVR